MSIGSIISDALAYPFQNVKALVLYLILALIAALIGGSALIGFIGAYHSTGFSSVAFAGMSLIGIIIFVLVYFLIEGYGLDVVKYGIERRSDSPGIDMGRQISNAIKLVVVTIVYFIIPVIITFVLGLFLRNWLVSIIALILFIVFALANFMAKCRLAKTDDLGAALAIGEAIGDISRVGFVKILGVAAIVVIILLIISIIIVLLNKLNTTLASIILAIASVYFVLFYNRAVGLLYSD
ncbi:MAG: DUF4013 domain-containing protein [Methanobrevibacter sp.]|nr:DUF4013 domain-containing protein [Methanobrevibacter sp.]